MNTLLLFFALPVATIILAIVLEKILDCPVLVAATFFAIYLVVTFAVFDSSFLVYAIIYTILAFITAAIVKAICNFIKNCCNNQNQDISNDNQNNGCGGLNNRVDSIDNNCFRSTELYPMQNYSRRGRR